MYLLHEEAKNGVIKLERPLFTICTENFNKNYGKTFDQWGSQKALHDFNITKKGENIFLKKCWHLE